MPRARVVTVAVPVKIIELTREQKNQLRKAFRTTIANELRAIGAGEVSDITIQNVTSVAREPTKAAAKPRKKSAAKKGSK